MHASVLGSPVMDMLRDDGSRRCDERRALLGYSSYDSDNDSDKESTKRWLGKSGDGKSLHCDWQMRRYCCAAAEDAAAARAKRQVCAMLLLLYDIT